MENIKVSDSGSNKLVIETENFFLAPKQLL